MFSARAWDNRIPPFSPSEESKKTSTSSPTLTRIWPSRSRNSSIGTWPSVLYPTSIMTCVSLKPTTLPLTTARGGLNVLIVLVLRHGTVPPVSVDSHHPRPNRFLNSAHNLVDIH